MRLKNKSGIKNFIARIYSTNPKEIEEYVYEFSELEQYFDEPIRNYSSGMRSRLNFAVSLAMQFECYLVDEATATEVLTTFVEVSVLMACKAGSSQTAISSSEFFRKSIILFKSKKTLV